MVHVGATGIHLDVDEFSRTNGRKAIFFAMWRGKTLGVFYKWSESPSDCKEALRGYKNSGFKGYRTLQEAIVGLRQN